MAAREKQRSTRIAGPDAVALGTWLAFLVITLVAIIWFVSSAPPLVGRGHLPILAGGSIFGLLISVAVGYRCRDLWLGRGRWGRAKIGAVLLMLGSGGGAAGAELLNLKLPPVDERVVDRPIVEREIARAGGRRLFRVVTLASDADVGIDRPVLDEAQWRGTRPGLCLYSRRIRGALGGDWIDAQAVDRCSLRRGRPGDTIIVTGTADDWRWHRADRGQLAVGRAVDTALPPGTVCRTRPGALWLYRCEPSASARAMNRS